MELLISSRSHETGAVNTARCDPNGGLTLGRGPDSLLRLDGTGISREHLRVHAESGALFVTDLSSNGTWLNAHRLTRGEPHPITSADEIRIPGFEIHIETQTLVPTIPSAPAPASLPRSGPRALIGKLGVSLSGGETLLVMLALGTLTVVVLYLIAG